MTYKETLLFIGKCLTISHEEKNKLIVEKELKSEHIDWDFVVEVSTAHYVFPALYCNLKRADFLHYVPEELVNYMIYITDLNRDRNQQIIAQAKEINELLLANDITPIFLKGTGNLLEGLYEDIAERMVGDIDFLVSEKDFMKSVNLLKKDDYKATKTKLHNPVLKKHYPRSSNKQKISAVEIHFEILRGKSSLYFNYKTINDSLLKKNEYTFLDYGDQLTLSILSNQYNDYGYFYKTINLRNTYDVYLLSFKTNSFSFIEKHNMLFKYLNAYLFVSSFFLNSKKISYKKTLKSRVHLQVLLMKLDYFFFAKLHTHFWKVLIYIYLKFLGGIRFMTNKQFRKYYIKKLVFLTSSKSNPP